MTAQAPEMVRWCIVHALPWNECPKQLALPQNRANVCFAQMIARSRLRSLPPLDEDPDA